MKYLITIVFTLLFSICLYANDNISCENFIYLKNVKITNVIDGDTFNIMYYDLPLKVRLIGVDAFEISKKSINKINMQKEKSNKTEDEIVRLGKEAKLYFKNNYENKNVCLIINKKHLFDVYSRTLGIILQNPNCEISDKKTEMFQNIILNNDFGIKYYIYKNDSCEENFLFN